MTKWNASWNLAKLITKWKVPEIPICHLQLGSYKLTLSINLLTYMYLNCYYSFGYCYQSKVQLLIVILVPIFQFHHNPVDPKLETFWRGFGHFLQTIWKGWCRLKLYILEMAIIFKIPVYGNRKQLELHLPARAWRMCWEQGPGLCA